MLARTTMEVSAGPAVFFILICLLTNSDRQLGKPHQTSSKEQRHFRLPNQSAQDCTSPFSQELTERRSVEGIVDSV